MSLFLRFDISQIARQSAQVCLDTLLPPRCLGCGTIVDEARSLCATCWRGLTFLGPPCCRQCGYPLPQAIADGPICGACAVEPPVFDRARAALAYDDGARSMILRFKHADRTDIARTFGRMLERAGDELLRDSDLIAPVPLHRWRLLRRGYNQSALLACALADGGRRTAVPDLLQRVRATASQQGLSGQQRRDNIQPRAFRLHPRYAQRVMGQRILLIDDVLTTGATVVACTRVLMKAGAASVDVLALARVVRHDVSTISSGNAEDIGHRPADLAVETNHQRRCISDAQS